MEEWRNIEGFPGYQVSDEGRVRTFWSKRRCESGYGTYRHYDDEPHIMPQSDDGNGYMKVFLRSDEYPPKKRCIKVHRLVAEAFISKPDGDDYTVDHIRSGSEGKLDNSIKNLRWISRPENIRKAYRDGMCDERIARQNKPIIAIDLWTGEERFYRSIGEAADDLYLDRSSISHVLIGDYERARHYTFEYAGREEVLLYGYEGY